MVPAGRTVVLSWYGGYDQLKARVSRRGAFHFVLIRISIGPFEALNDYGSKLVGRPED